MGLSNASEYVQGLYGDVTNILRGTLLMQPTIKAYDSSTWVLDNLAQMAAQRQETAEYQAPLEAAPVAQVEGETLSPNGRFQVRTAGKSDVYLLMQQIILISGYPRLLF